MEIFGHGGTKTFAPRKKMGSLGDFALRGKEAVAFMPEGEAPPGLIFRAFETVRPSLEKLNELPKAKWPRPKADAFGYGLASGT